MKMMSISISSTHIAASGNHNASGNAGAAQPETPGGNPAAQPAQATSNAGAPGAAPAQPAATAPIQAFAQIFDRQLDVLPALQVDAAAPAARDGAAADVQDASAADAAAPQDGALLAAMAMPLMPLTPMQIAQALQLAQGGAPAGDGAAQDADAGADRAGQAAGAIGQDGARLPGPGLSQPATPATPAPAPDQDGATLRLALQADAGKHAGGSGADGGDGADQGAAPAAPAAATPMHAGAAAATASNQPGADTLKLAGPPTAWRQSLQEALGERLNVQVGRNMEQAVIRLEPPQLGRIDIAIRHSAGTLEVNISASNGEVLRQLQTVSDNLRSDLSQRQFTEVAVSVTPLPKNGAAPFGDPQQGRGRQQGRGQDEQEPGRALAEASNPTSIFSLNSK